MIVRIFGTFMVVLALFAVGCNSAADNSTSEPDTDVEMPETDISEDGDNSTAEAP